MRKPLYYHLKDLSRWFWWTITRLRPFENANRGFEAGPITQFAFRKWKHTLSGCRGWTTRNGKLVYFEI